MLPGFRFLFAAIVLSVSIAVFGFGAAALFRSAHEEFANAPAWRPAPETRFAQADPPAQPAALPVLAMLRVDDSAKETPKTELPAVAPAPVNQAAPEPIEPEQTATQQPTDSAPSTAAKPDVQIAAAPAAETTFAASPAPAPAETAPKTPDPAQVEASPPPAVPVETKAAAAEPASAPLSEDPSAWPPETFDAPPETSAISTRIATLGGPPVLIEQPGAKAARARAEALAEAKADSALAKRQRARRAAARRHRIAAARARLAQQASQMEQPTPFGPPAALLQPR